MYRIIMSISFVIILVASYFLTNGSSTNPTQQEVQQTPQSGSTFNNL